VYRSRSDSSLLTPACLSALEATHLIFIAIHHIDYLAPHYYSLNYLDFLMNPPATTTALDKLIVCGHLMSIDFSYISNLGHKGNYERKLYQ
jgi:hypothetical protein